jgi:ADP-heptose:LPS heptosyltransferase
MQIAAHHLQTIGHRTVTFSSALLPLAHWFPAFSFEPQPSLNQIEETLAPFDAILLQHDNTPHAKKICEIHKIVYVFYGSHSVAKHGTLRPYFDVVFNSTICMAKNIQKGLKTIFPGTEPSLENGLTPPAHLVHQRFTKRIALHATSTSEDKNWPQASFIKLQVKLQKEGWSPLFIAPPEEAKKWNSPILPTLGDLAAFLYESYALIGNDSGPGHLASNLGLPTTIIGPSYEQLTFWRPGWYPCTIVHPPAWAGKTKLTKKNWKIFITINNVYKQFKKLTDIK